MTNDGFLCDMLSLYICLDIDIYVFYFYMSKLFSTISNLLCDFEGSLFNIRVSVIC